jgi:hypothetical protein
MIVLGFFYQTKSIKMKTETAVSLEFANDILFHIKGEKKLSRDDIANKVIEIVNTLSDLLPYIDKIETMNNNLKDVNKKCIERLSQVTKSNLSDDYNYMISERAGRQLQADNEELKSKLLEMETKIYKAELDQRNKF